MPHLFGKRIRLRAAEKEDITTFLRWINDPEVTENLGLISPFSRFEEEQWYEEMMKRPVHEHVFVIGIKEGTQDKDYLPIGTCQFFQIDWLNRSSEIGIMIGEKTYWDQGYGTETMQLLLKHAFETLNLHRIWLRVYDKNKRGIRAYEKAGFKHEGTLREAHYQHNRYYDIHLMSVLSHKWQINQSMEEEK